jgi:tetratricopeptide (TPR) repeat protein
MAAPVVTRPPAVMPHEPRGAQANVKWIPFAVWSVLLCLAAAAIGVIIAVVTNWQDERRLAALRADCDVVDAALKEKVKPDDRIAALEGVADKVNGTSAHAWTLAQLASLYFDKATDPLTKPEEQAKALKTATALWQQLSEQYKDNPAFGPLALSNVALAYEQAQDLDKAIQILKDGLSADLSSHFLYEKMTVQLGRLYWLRSRQEAEAGKAEDAEKDRKEALKYVSLNIPEGKDKSSANWQWREEARYIKSLVDEPGKLLPGGKIPPEKKAPEPPPAAAAPAAVPVGPRAANVAPAAPAPVSPAAAPAEKKAEEKKPASPAPAAPPVEKKAEEKKDAGK